MFDFKCHFTAFAIVCVIALFNLINRSLVNENKKEFCQLQSLLCAHSKRKDVLWRFQKNETNQEQIVSVP